MTLDVEVWLYGSRARGDADADSDTDLLVVGPPGCNAEVAVAGLTYPRTKVSFYSWDELRRMHAYGSLYLLHIRTEGRQLRSSHADAHRLTRLLADLPPFSRAEEDLAGFRRALAESRASLADGGWPDFECEVVATVARHAAILGSYCTGEPAFGRERPFHVVGRALGYNASAVCSLAESATAWRLHQPGPHTEPGAMHGWLAQVSRFLDELEGVINDYAGVLREAA